VHCLNRPFRREPPLPRFAAALLLLAMLVAIGGCGPGVGNSASDSDPVDWTAALANFDAVAGSVCDSTLSRSLPCPARTDAAALDGPTTAEFVDQESGGHIVLTVQGDGALLDLRCKALRFEGIWAVDAAGRGQFVGHAMDSTGTGAGVHQTLAKLTLNAQGNGYQAVLSNPDNAVLVGPISFIAPVSPRTAAAACP
jgi:hypothetical protein